MIFFINYSKDKINIYSFSCPPFLFVRAQQSFVCQPVSRDSGAGAGWLTIEKWFLLLIDCAVRHDLPAVFLILRLLCPERISFEVFLSDVCFTNPFSFLGALPGGQSCSFACRNSSLILIYRHRVKSVCKSLNSYGELSLC